MKTRYAAEQHFEDFWKIIQTHVLHRFKHNKLSYADYQKMGKIERANKFYLPKGLLERMGRFKDESGKMQRHAMQFIRQLEEQGKVIYHAKVTRFYTTSEKRFDLPPWIEITSSQLQILLVLDREGKFELTERQMKLVKHYFPKKEETTDEQAETAQPETQQLQEPQKEPKTTQPEQPKPTTRMEFPPVYADAMHDINVELHAMRDATTKEELKAAAVRVDALLRKYAHIWPERCDEKSRDARQYIAKFKERMTA